MRKTFFKGMGTLLSATILLSAGLAMADNVTKQLKNVNLSLIQSDENDPAVPSESDSTASSPTTPDPSPTQPMIPNQAGNLQSYSIVTESHIGPDGKRVQKKKVWKNGELVVDEEKTLDNADLSEDLSAELDGQNSPGVVIHSEESNDLPFGMEDLDPTLSPDAMGGNDFQATPESLRQLRDRMRAEQAEMLRRFNANFPGMGMGGMPGIPLTDPEGNLISPANPGFAPQGPVALSEYWIGASVTPVTPDLAAQLDLPEGEGMVIREIVPDSPAAKAGLTRFDILLKFGDETIGDIHQIQEAVDQAAETPITIEYLRKGKKETVELTPEKRPTPDQINPMESMNSVSGNNATPQQEQIRVVRPGMIVPKVPNQSIETTEPAESTDRTEPDVTTDPDATPEENR